MCCHPGSGSLVVPITWDVTLDTLVMCNFKCHLVFFLKILLNLFSVIFCSTVIVLVDFKMNIVTYSSVQNSLAYYFSVYIHVYMYFDVVHKNETFVLYLAFTASQNHFTHFEPSQSLGEAKTGDPREKPPGHAKAELCLTHSVSS